MNDRSQIASYDKLKIQGINMALDLAIWSTIQKPMDIAIELSRLGAGYVFPNPCVGAVILKGNQLVGYGYHQYYGGSHAEVVAIEMALVHLNSLNGCNIFVTLEPCCHTGNTGPCTDIIIKSGISSVYFASYDPNPIVSGKGIQKLRSHGINTVFMQEYSSAVKKINDLYFHAITRNSPFVIAKLATTIDCKIATRSNVSKWITCKESRIHAHKIRNSVDAIIVGRNTAQIDNPYLNVRLTDAIKKNTPIRVVIDPTGKLKADLNIFDCKIGPTCVISSVRYPSYKKEVLKNIGVQFLEYPEPSIPPQWIIHALYDKFNTRAILVEGGGATFMKFFEGGVIHKILLYMSPKIIGDPKSIPAFYSHESVHSLDNLKQIKFDSVEKVGSDIVITAYN